MVPTNNKKISHAPISCAECELGRFALYGPTIAERPDDIYVRRRSVWAVEAGKTFLREGEPAKQFCTLYAGWAFYFKRSSTGRRQILTFLIPGDGIVLESLSFPGLRLPFSVRSVTQIEMCVFDLQDMAVLARACGAQSQELAREMRARVVSLTQSLLDIGQKSAEGRLAHLIHDLEQRLSSRGLSINGSFDFPIRQKHLADALGLTNVYVNRVLERFRKQNIIQLERGRMHIQDFDTLRKLAEVD